jgi:hypothetical protein
MENTRAHDFFWQAAAALLPTPSLQKIGNAGLRLGISPALQDFHWYADGLPDE